jgi:ubiquinol-cytochrome c reductase cytochrome b subunit
MKAYANLPLMFTSPRTRAIKRIGPHNIDILSIIIGSLLGDAYAEKHGLGTRICFQQEDNHSAYLYWLQ